MKINEIKLNKSNPRLIKDHKFEKLKKSISEFPKMLELRPMIIDDQNIVLGGNMRLTALKDLGYKEIPDNWVKRASELTEEEKQRFIIADNVGFGDWDWDILANEWDAELIADWGLDVPDTEILDKEGNYESEEIYEDPLQLHPEIEYILVICDKNNIDEAREHFGLGFVKKNNGAKDKIVKNRTVIYNEYVNSNTK